MEKAKTERIKQLLSSYYGSAGPGAQQPGSPGGSSLQPSLSQQQQQQQQQQLQFQQQQSVESMGSGMMMGGARASTGSVLSLDSPAFNPDRHIAHMIQTYSIDRLMAEHKGMAKEIKNLDSDMQQLVYENYNKFIAATDTIRSMKSNVDGMETDIDQLRSNMDMLVQRSSIVNAKLLKRRQHIEELNRVQGLLVKLQAVFDLPSRMQAALEEDALDSAVSFYAEALPVLRKYGHKGAFRGVAVQADAAAKQVSTALKRRLAERKGETEHVVLLLRQLGEGDDTLQEKYLQGRKERMQRILQEAGAVADAMAAAAQAPARSSRGSSDNGSTPLPAVEDPASWGVGADGSVPSVNVFVKALDERLINALAETVMNMNTIFLQNDRTAARRKGLVLLAKDIISEYFRLIRRVVSEASMAAAATAACLHLAGGDKDFRVTAPSLTFPDTWGADLVMQAMSAVTTDIGLLHSQLPELSLRDLAAAATEQAVQGHINAAFAALQERLNSGVAMLCNQLSSQTQGQDLQAQVQPLLPAYNYLCDVIQKGTAALLKGLCVYEQGRLLSAWQDRLSDSIQAQLAALFNRACSQFLQLSGVKEGASQLNPRDDGAAGKAGQGTGGLPPNTGLVLVLAKLCVHMETTTVPHVVEVLAGAFQGRGLAGSDGPPRFVGGEVARRLGATANLLLSSYVELHGSELSLLVQQSMAAADWLTLPAPAGPQPVCNMLLQRLGRAEAEVGRLLESTGRQQGGGHGESGSHQRGGSLGDVLESGAVERGVAKLFRGKVTPFGSAGLRFTQSAALSAIAIVGLKSLLEHTRLLTLSRGGLQQLQLDVSYMRPRLLQLVGGVDAEPVAQVLDDIVAAAAERSTDPVLLDAAAVEKALVAAGSARPGA